MCTIPTIRLVVMMLSWLKGVFMIYIFAVGCYFAGSLDLHHGYGLSFVSYGLSFIFLSLLSLGMIYPLKYGVDRHNRFLLAMVFVFETIVFAQLINLGVTVQSYTFPQFSKSMQADCLKHTPSSHTIAECNHFYNADRTAGFRLVWAYYFSTLSKKSSYQFLSTLQAAGCCGFFPPFECSPITSNYPKSFSTEGISGNLLEQRVLCGPYPNYYPQQDNCIDYYDYGANPPIIGGCRYDMSVGYCMTQTVEDTSFGCASTMEDYISSLVSPHVPMILVTSIMCFLYMLIACCMWWKRKETDVFPEFLLNKDRQVDYKKVKNDFELTPKPGLLQSEGFLPRAVPEESKEGPDSEERDDDEDEGDEESQPVEAVAKSKPQA